MNPNLYPPGGFFFKDHNGFKHVGLNWDDLERKVRHYREMQRLPVGDVRAEIMAQACSRNPGHCREFSTDPVQVRQPLSFNNRVIEWLSRMIGLKRLNALPRVDDGEAARRAAVCVGCPRQQALFHGCSTCMNAINGGRKAILEGCSSLHPYLKSCGVLGEDCQIAIHIEQPKIASGDLPGNCWRKG